MFRIVSIGILTLTLIAFQNCTSEGDLSVYTGGSSTSSGSEEAASRIELEFLSFPSDSNVVEARDLTLRAQVTGEGVTYQWLYNNVNVDGATTDTLTITNASEASHAGTYTLVATDDENNNLSRSLVVTVSAQELDGATLYSQNCAGCHGALASSAKRDATFNEIQQAREDVAGMENLDLSDAQVNAIVAALDDPDVLGGGRTSISFTRGNLTLLTNERAATMNRDLLLQGDGNLVLYRHLNGANRVALWASNTVNSGGNRAVFQSDGNFVLYNGANQVVFSTGTQDIFANIMGENILVRPGGQTLIIQSDGNMVIYNSANQALWASDTVGP